MAVLVGPARAGPSARAVCASTPMTRVKAGSAAGTDAAGLVVIAQPTRPAPGLPNATRVS